MTALYDSEKSQNLALEEAVAAEKENFNKVKTRRKSENLDCNLCWQVVASLDSERQRSRAVSTKVKPFETVQIKKSRLK